MIDHVLFRVTNVAKSKKFYVMALKPLGLRLKVNSPKFVGFGDRQSSPFWLSPGTKVSATKNSHVAFLTNNRKAVDEFYKCAIKAGGKSNGEPGPRAEHGEHAYAAYVFDLAGNNIEAVCYAAPKKSKKSRLARA